MAKKYGLPENQDLKARVGNVDRLFSDMNKSDRQVGGKSKTTAKPKRPRAIDPTSGKAMIRGRPVENAPGPEDPSFGAVFGGFRSKPSESLGASLSRVGRKAVTNAGQAVKSAGEAAGRMGSSRPVPARPKPRAPRAKPAASTVPNPDKSMPGERIIYHRNPKVSVFPNTVENEQEGKSGRARGIGDDVMRKGRPVAAGYSGDRFDRAALAAEAGNNALYEGLSGNKKRKR